jgi:hypothetical protein
VRLKRQPAQPADPALVYAAVGANFEIRPLFWPQDGFPALSCHRDSRHCQMEGTPPFAADSIDTHLQQLQVDPRQQKHLARRH